MTATVTRIGACEVCHAVDVLRPHPDAPGTLWCRGCTADPIPSDDDLAGPTGLALLDDRCGPWADLRRALIDELREARLAGSAPGDLAQAGTARPGPVGGDVVVR